MNSTIIFITCNEMPELTASDAVAAEALGVLGVNVLAAPWNGDQTLFHGADLIVIRSTWDYPAHHAMFRNWLGALNDDARVVNPPSLMRWNLSKRYLLELAGKGAPVPALKLVSPEARAIAQAMDTLGLDKAVVKPEFGATGSGLSLVSRDDVDGLESAARKLAMPGFVQALIPEISDFGETSLMYFNGDYSHAVTKRPMTGQILCQEEHGGTTVAANPPDWAIADGARILEMLPGLPLYARVDAIIPAGGLDETMRLMEVELIEPELFFPYCPHSADRFADALMKRMNKVK